MSNSDGSVGPPPFDQALADSYIGKHILVGVTYFNHAGEMTRREQMHGIVTGASLKGIIVALKGANEGRSWAMPPDTRSISAARPGEYSLKETGEIVINPDLIAQWQITEPQKH